MCLPRSKAPPAPPPPPEVKEPTKQEIYDSTPHQVSKTSSSKKKSKGKTSLRTDLGIGSGSTSGLNVGY